MMIRFLLMICMIPTMNIAMEMAIIRKELTVKIRGNCEENMIIARKKLEKAIDQGNPKIIEQASEEVAYWAGFKGASIMEKLRRKAIYEPRNKPRQKPIVQSNDKQDEIQNILDEADQVVIKEEDPGDAIESTH